MSDLNLPDNYKEFEKRVFEVKTTLITIPARQIKNTLIALSEARDEVAEANKYLDERGYPDSTLQGRINLMEGSMEAELNRQLETITDLKAELERLRGSEG